MNNQKNYYAVIPSALLCRKDINDKGKLLIAIINNLSNEKGYCWANNHYLAESLGCDERTIQRTIAALEKQKIITRVMKLDSSGNLEFRALTVIDHMTNFVPPNDKNGLNPYDKSVIHNNKDINNKYTIYSFDSFWNEYGKKIDTAKCKEKYSKLSETDREKIKNTLPSYLANTTDIKFRKNPLTYLNGKCWLDEVKEPVKEETEREYNLRLWKEKRGMV